MAAVVRDARHDFDTLRVPGNTDRLVSMLTPRAYYNEFDNKAAAWLRELIKGGYIAAGDVDERSIVNVSPNDLRGYTQCHFFAGIGGWSYALRLAGWPDDRPVWTGSCPCQPFSAAGKRGGTADERHLWPQFFRLIDECRPTVVFGEQVASKDGLAWLDAVYADLEGADYAVGAADLCAAGVGAPHIRQRLYFVADYGGERRQWRPDTSRPVAQDTRQRRESVRNVEPRGEYGELAVTESEQHDWRGDVRRERGDGRDELLTWAASVADELGDPGEPRTGRDAGAVFAAQAQRSSEGLGNGHRSVGVESASSSWYPCDWLPCTDGKARPIEPGTFPLAHGVPGRVGLLRGYGNAIVPQVAAEFIGAYLDITEGIG